MVSRGLLFAEATMTIGEYVELAGDPVAGIVLSQLSYWFLPSKSGNSKLRVERGGKLWLAKSRSDLARECHLSPDQVKRALVRLRSRNLVLSEQHLFANRTINHFWVDVGALKSHLGGADSHSLGGANTHSPGGACAHRPYNVTVNTTETQTETTAVAQSAKAVEELISPTSEGEMTTAKEILKRFKEKKEEKTEKSEKTGETGEEKKITVSSLCLLWKRRISTDGKFHHDLGGKERGQLKLFLEKAGPHAYQALDFVLQSWGKFAFEAKSKYGLSVVPSQPVPGFVLQYYDVAVQSIAEKSAKAVNAQPKKETPKAQVTETKPDVAAPSLEQIQADLALLEAKAAAKKGGGL